MIRWTCQCEFCHETGALIERRKTMYTHLFDLHCGRGTNCTFLPYKHIIACSTHVPAFKHGGEMDRCQCQAQLSHQAIIPMLAFIEPMLYAIAPSSLPVTYMTCKADTWMLESSSLTACFPAQHCTVANGCEHVCLVIPSHSVITLPVSPCHGILLHHEHPSLNE